MIGHMLSYIKVSKLKTETFLLLRDSKNLVNS
jgi:hypothetical protein